MKKYTPVFLFLILFSSSSTFAQVPVINLLTFSTGYSGPVDIKNCGDSRLFIVQQGGYVYICDTDGVKSTTPFLDIHTKISSSSERGLLGIAFHPDYFNNGYFFIYYTSIDSGKITISRFSVDSLNPDIADPNSEMVLLRIKHFDYANHNGGGLVFGPDGYLYAGTGDGGSFGDPAGNAQNKKSYLGKLLRFDVDSAVPYAVPVDNPFVSDTSFYPEIYAYGLRNPWRYSFDRLTGDLWIGDVGQDNWEEIDFAQYPDTGGQNYGWDCYEGTHTYQPTNCNGTDGLTFPIDEYQHSSGADGDCSITGGFLYRGSQYPVMYGKYFFIDYCSGKMRDLQVDASGNWTENLVGNFSNSNFSSFGEDVNGELYLAGVADGKIYKITEATTGINEAGSQSGINIYPNPGNGIFTVTLKNPADQVSEISIINIAGQLVMPVNASPFQQKTFTINASGLAGGIYFVRMKMSDNLIYQKLVIENQRK